MSLRIPSIALTLSAGALLCLARPARAEPSKAELVKILKTVDERQHSSGDFRSETHMEQTEKGKLAVVYETQVFRRSSDQRFLILFIHPKASQGQGYLRSDKNLWFYDPAVGKWERRTEREQIGGTNSRRSDFDESRLADEYDPEFVAEEKLGAYDTLVLKLSGKPDRDLAFPVVKIWIDKDNMNVMKRQEFALSGKLLRTCYFPKWKKIYSESKRGDVWFPEEARMYDEVEKEKSTLLLIKSIDVRPLDANIFTKAWLESKSR